MYIKNNTLSEILDNMVSAVNVEKALRQRGQGERTEEQFKALRQQVQDLRELQVAWMTLQDLVELEDRTLEGLHSGAPTADEWRAVFDRARELFTNPSIIS